MSWLGDLILAGVAVLGNAVPVPLRRKINFSGDFAVTDNPSQQRTDVALAGGVAGLGAATSAATPLTIGKRSASGSLNRGGTSVDDIVRVNELRINADVTESRVQNTHVGQAQGGGGDWAYSGEVSWISQSLGGRVTFPIDLPHGAKLTQVSVEIIGASGHSALPVTPPSVQVRKFGALTGSADVGASASDPSLSTVFFESVHFINAAGLNEVVDNTAYRYFVLVTAESSTNALVGATILSVIAAWTRTAGSTLAQD